ncbi:MAG: penicillin-binding protein 2 [Anaerolineae bacterium]
MNSGYVRFRLLAFRAVLVIGLVAIVLKLWTLQVVSSQEYIDAADQNRYRLVSIDAPRGVIYDRQGRKLVHNVPGFTVSVVPGDLPADDAEREIVLEHLSALLALPVRASDGSGIDDLIQAGTTGPYATGPFVPIVIARKVDRQAAFSIQEDSLALPGVTVEGEPEREYLDSELMAHIVGYMGRINQTDLAARAAQGYEPGDRIGLTGVERTQEAVLAGVKGQKHIEVNVDGRETRVIAAEEPVPGHSIYLTIDTVFQRKVEAALSKGMQAAGSEVGVAIAMDPRTGEILAMVSLPTFDNNLFASGISYQDLATLSNDPRFPLINHAVGGQYPPGSVFKIIPASGALEEGVLTESTTLDCRGTMLLPNKFFPTDLSQAQTFYCWSRYGHGSINVVTAISQSCDIFFYKATGGFEEFQGLGIDRLGSYAAMFGIGERTGVELTGEASGLLPSERWKRLTYSESWFTGDTYNAAIGQGYVLVTPLQMLNATAAIANRGTLYRPQVVYQEVDIDGSVVRPFEPEVIRELDVSPKNIELVRRGMRGTVTNGTAYRLRLPEVDVAGKTGTAEYTELDENGNVIMDEWGYLPTHAYFTAFAPYDDPEIALIVFLQGGGEGSQTAVPVGEEILRAYFDIPLPGAASVTGVTG